MTKILKGVDDIAICQFNQSDVVRHQLVQKIIEAYENFEKKRDERKRTYGDKNSGRH